MNEKDIEFFYNMILKIYGEDAVKSLHSEALKSHPELEDSTAFKKWLIEYASDSLTELFDDYNIDVN